MVKVAPATWVSSASLSVMLASSTVGALPSVKASVPLALSAAASFTAVRLSVLVAVPVAAPSASLLASVTAQLSVRVVWVPAAVGSSPVWLKPTARSASR